MKHKLIGITGPAQCGKDTVADYLIERLGYAKASFADPLKKMLEAGLGLNAAQLYGPDKEAIAPRYGCSPRHIMQTLGTEWGRERVHPDIWVRAMVAQMDDEGFGGCTNQYECEAVCPKEIPVSMIAKMNREFFKASVSNK